MALSARSDYLRMLVLQLRTYSSHRTHGPSLCAGVYGRSKVLPKSSQNRLKSDCKANCQPLHVHGVAAIGEVELALSLSLRSEAECTAFALSLRG